MSAFLAVIALHLRRLAFRTAVEQKPIVRQSGSEVLATELAINVLEAAANGISLFVRHKPLQRGLRGWHLLDQKVPDGLANIIVVECLAQLFSGLDGIRLLGLIRFGELPSG